MVKLNQAQLLLSKRIVPWGTALTQIDIKSRHQTWCNHQILFSNIKEGQLIVFKNQVCLRIWTELTTTQRIIIRLQIEHKLRMMSNECPRSIQPNQIGGSFLPRNRLVIKSSHQNLRTMLRPLPIREIEWLIWLSILFFNDF